MQVGESLATMRSGGEKSKRMICGSGVAYMVVIVLLYLCLESLKTERGDCWWLFSHDNELNKGTVECKK
jgi:hypothetical protein